LPDAALGAHADSPAAPLVLIVHRLARIGLERDGAIRVKWCGQMRRMVLVRPARSLLTLR
jgi:hypothetical protein